MPYLIARWTVARALRGLGRHAEALEVQEKLRAECDGAGRPDGYVYEELAENHLAIGRRDGELAFVDDALGPVHRDPVAFPEGLAVDADGLVPDVNVERAATDERNFVKKAVNWAIRNIGKRNPALNRAALRLSRRLRATGSHSARWIAGDAIRELESEPVRKRLRARSG